MDNIKDLMKKVKMPEAIHIVPKSMPENGINLKALKRELDEKKNEKIKTYGFIGMEVYDLSKENKIEIPQIKGYLDKMDELNQVIDDLERKIKEQEVKNAGKNVCSCGCKLKPQDRFCPSCGEIVQKDNIICICGAELEQNARFCRSCGKSIDDIKRAQEEAQKPQMKECICGAKVPEGQFMCLECGRKIE